jgi:tetratricopeptide (TPR) repeat protein
MAEKKWLFEVASDISPYENELAQHQVEIAERCDEFHRFFPDSRYMPNALFIRARAWDRRVDLEEFRRTKWIRFYDDFPSPASRESWQILLANRPDSVPGAVARLRLALLEAREGDVDRALDKLSQIIVKFDAGAQLPEPSPKQPDKSGPLAVLASEAAEATLKIPLQRVVLDAHRLHDLLAANRDPLYGYEPLTGRRRADEFAYGFLDLDPRSARYLDSLAALVREYPNCQIEDNIALEITRAEPDPQARAAALKGLVARFPSGDAVPEALLQLGLAYKALGRQQEAADALARLMQSFPASVWARQASQFAPWIDPSRVARTP